MVGGATNGDVSNELITHGAPPGLVRLVRSIEEDARLDPVAGALERLTAPLDDPARRDLLSGAWLGHALHPLLTDFPLGAWMSATLLDLFGGRRSRPAAQALVAFGVAMAVPTVASGVVEWRRTAPREARVGIVHAAGNSLAAACYAKSMGPRQRGRGFRAAFWSVSGGLVATVSGYLGGHLTLARKVGSHDAAFAGDGNPGAGPGGAAEG